jgi:lipoprotein-anchoring transpeptidase ErfK/SrfK
MAASSVGPRGAVTRLGALPLVALGVAIVLALLALGTYLYDHSRRDLIASGVRIAGVPVGGLRESAARGKLERVLVTRLNQPVRLHSGTRTWTLDPRQAHVRVELATMLQRALSASREGSIFTRTARGLFGGSVNRDIPVLVGYSHHAVSSLTAKIRAQVNRPPRDATVQPTATGLNTVRGEVGLSVNSDLLGSRVNAVLAGSGASRAIGVPTRKVQPKVTTAQLAAKYPAYIVIDRNDFRLRFYHHLKLERTYEIAVGMEGLETPAGLHKVEWEQVNPPWYVPKKAWAGSLAGTVVPPGPADPLKARFMSFEGGAGIHGIDPSEYSSIGHDASHGCVRMRIPDVIALYSKTPVGTPVYII